MVNVSNLEAWFVTGSQHLYGTETLKTVEQHAKSVARAVGAFPQMPIDIVVKPVMTTSDAIHKLCQEANNSANCVGLITWMHTFLPGSDVDRRHESAQQTIRSLTYAVQ